MRKLRPKDSGEPAPGSPVRSGCLQRLSHYSGIQRQGLQGKRGWGKGVGRIGEECGGGAERAPPPSAPSPLHNAALTCLRVPPPLQALPRAAAADGVDPGGRGTRRPPPQLLHGQRRRPPGGPAAAARRGLRAAPAQVGLAGGAQGRAGLPGHPPGQAGRRRPAARCPRGFGLTASSLSVGVLQGCSLQRADIAVTETEAPLV